MNKITKAFNLLIISLLLGQMLMPTIALAAGSDDNTQYLMLTVLENNTDNSYGLKTIVQSDNSQGIIDGSSYENETSQSFWRQRTTPSLNVDAYVGTGSKPYEGFDKFTETVNASAGAYYNNYEAPAAVEAAKERPYPHSWNGLSDVSMGGTRYGASPNEAEYGQKTTNFLNEELLRAYEFIAFGDGYKSSNYDDISFIKDLARIAEGSRAAMLDARTSTGTIPLSSQSSLYSTSTNKQVTYTISKPNVTTDAKMLTDFKMPTFYNQNLTNAQKLNSLVKITVTNPDDNKDTKSQLFVYQLSKGYGKTEPLNSAIKNSVAAAKPNQSETELIGEVKDLTSKLPDYYNWSFMMQLVMDSYAYGEVKTSADLYKLENTQDSCLGSSAEKSFIRSIASLPCLLSSAAGFSLYYGLLTVFGIPSVPDFISPYGFFSSWWFGFIPMQLTGLVFTIFGFSVVFAAITKTFTLLAKYRNADKSAEQHSEFKDYVKNVLMYVITLIFFIALFFVFLKAYDMISQEFWKALNGGVPGSILGSNMKLRLSPGDLTGSGAAAFSIFYVLGTATWFLSVVFIKFRQMITLALAPIIAEEIITTDNETSGFNRFVELFVDTFVVLFVNLMSFMLLYILGNSVLGGMTVVMAVFVLGICASMFTIIMKRLGISKRLLNLPEGAVFTGMATKAMQTVTNDVQKAASGTSKTLSSAADSLTKDVEKSQKGIESLKDKAADLTNSTKTESNAVGKSLMADTLNNLQDTGEDAAKLAKAQNLNAAAAGLALLGGDIGGAAGLGAKALQGGNTGETPTIGEESVVGANMMADTEDLGGNIEATETAASKTGNWTGDTHSYNVDDTSGATQYKVHSQEDGDFVEARTNFDQVGESVLAQDSNLDSKVSMNDYLSGAYHDNGDKVMAQMNSEGIAGATRDFSTEHGNFQAQYDSSGQFSGFENESLLTASQLTSANQYIADNNLFTADMNKLSDIQSVRHENFQSGLATPVNAPMQAGNGKTARQADPASFAAGGADASVNFNDNGQAIMTTFTPVSVKGSASVNSSATGYSATFNHGAGHATETQKIVNAYQKGGTNKIDNPPQ